MNYPEEFEATLSNSIAPLDNGQYRDFVNTPEGKAAAFQGYLHAQAVLRHSETIAEAHMTIGPYKSELWLATQQITEQLTREEWQLRGTLDSIQARTYEQLILQQIFS